MKLVQSQEFEGVEILTVGQKPFGKPRLTVNLFYIDDLLIDTGPSRLFKEVLHELEREQIRQIFVTHHHEDHTGNVAQLSKHFDCPALSSQKCTEMMKNPPRISFIQFLTWGSRSAFEGLVGTETLQTEKYSFELIDIPGHASDMVALYEPQKKWLFSADLYVHHYISYFLNSESVQQQIASLERVLQLDFETLFCSHGPPMKDGREKLTKKLSFMKLFYEQVSEQAEKGHSVSKIMKELNLKERWDIRILSHGMLSKLNMVKSVMRDMKVEAEL